MDLWRALLAAIIGRGSPYAAGACRYCGHPDNVPHHLDCPWGTAEQLLGIESRE